MSTFMDEELMDYESEAPMDPPTDREEVLLTLSLKWLDKNKKKTDLQKSLQTRFNKFKTKIDCTVQEILLDGRAVILVSPPPGLKALQKLSGETLSTKDKKQLATILSIMLEILNQDPQTAEDASVNPTPPAASANTKTADLAPPAGHTLTQWKDPPRRFARRIRKAISQNFFWLASQQQLQRKLDMVFSVKSGNPFTSIAETAQESCLLPLNHFWYMSHIYKEGIKQIERKNKVKMVAQVTFEAEQEDGNPHEALNEFIDLSQSCSADSGEAVIPLKFVDQWSDALKVIKRNKDKILLTMSSEEVIVSGPKQRQDEFSAVLNAMQKTNTQWWRKYSTNVLK